jgi:hypothetical protein
MIYRAALLATIAFVAPASVAVAQARASATPANSIELVLKPVREPSGNVTTLDVTLRFVDTVQNQAFAVRAPLTVYSHTGIADRLHDLRMSDSKGDVSVAVVDEGGNRIWRAGRAVTWPLTVHYSAVVPQARTVAGPPIDLRTFAGGVSMGGQGFLALPADSRPYHIRLRWDLGTLATGSTAVTGLGEGDLETVAPLGSLQRVFYLAGPLGRYPERGDVAGFSAFWLGEKDSVNMRGEMAWGADAYAKLRQFFHDSTPRNYRFFTRVLPEPATSGGTASLNSFMLQVPKPTRGNSPDGTSTLSRGTMVHEMIHGWVGGISGSGNTQWFGEGATTYFTARTELKLSLMPLEALAREYTNLSRDYYPNPYRNVSADSAAGAFWLSKEGERLPYARGSLYFMDLNARIKKASGGRRSLDDVMFSLFAKRAAGGSLSTDQFLAAIAGELGPPAAAEFDSIVVRGTKTIALAPDTFGPCFTRRTVTIPVPDFFFRRNETRRIVTGLRGQSAAFEAGLRDGDEVTNQVDTSSLSTTQPVILEIRRGEQTQTIRYTSRPISVESYEWIVNPSVDEHVCRTT